jgi:hypothetical protein
MKPLRPFVLAASLFAAGPVCAADPSPAASATGRPTVVELFTSQGCSSCPPADALLGELTRRPDVLPLAFHVDYWNRLGWKDPYASAEATARQRGYARLLDLRTIYTPQMVVDGRIDVIGSERANVLKAIDRARAAQVTVPIELATEAGGLRVRVGAGEAPSAGASLWLVGFDRQRVTKIGAGENGGRTLPEWHIVRGFTRLPDWTGTAQDVGVPAQQVSGYERVAVLLQDAAGRMLGAAALDAQLAAKQ